MQYAHINCIAHDWTHYRDIASLGPLVLVVHGITSFFVRVVGILLSIGTVVSGDSLILLEVYTFHE